MHRRLIENTREEQYVFGKGVLVINAIGLLTMIGEGWRDLLKKAKRYCGFFLVGESVWQSEMERLMGILNKNKVGSKGMAKKQRINHTEKV